jgi:hypothetical protein
MRMNAVCGRGWVGRRVVHFACMHFAWVQEGPCAPLPADRLGRVEVGVQEEVHFQGRQRHLQSRKGAWGAGEGVEFFICKFM